MTTMSVDDIQRDPLGYLHCVEVGKRSSLCKQISQSQKLNLHRRMLLQDSFGLLVCAQASVLYQTTLMRLCQTICLTPSRVGEAAA